MMGGGGVVSWRGEEERGSLHSAPPLEGILVEIKNIRFGTLMKPSFAGGLVEGSLWGTPQPQPGATFRNSESPLGSASASRRVCSGVQ